MRGFMYQRASNMIGQKQVIAECRCGDNKRKFITLLAEKSSLLSLFVLPFQLLFPLPGTTLAFFFDVLSL